MLFLKIIETTSGTLAAAGEKGLIKLAINKEYHTWDMKYVDKLKFLNDAKNN